MANTIILRRSSTAGKVPTPEQLQLGEVAINTHDGRMFIKKDDGTVGSGNPSVVEIGGVTSVNGVTGSVTIDTGDVAENGNLYFTQARARGALSAGSGISYNSSTGVISTTQNLSTAGSPTFAGLTLTGDVDITGDIIPSADITYDLGSPTRQWKDIYVGPGSLYVNGTKVLQDDSGTIAFTADPDQNIRINAVGAGVLQLGSSTTNVNVDGTLQIASGKNITDSAGVQVNFGDNIQMNSNKVVGLGAPSASTDAATKGYVDTQVASISTSTISQGNSSVAVVDTGTGVVNVTVDGSTALSVTATGVVVAGNFTVQGTTTTVESNTVSVADNILTLNSDVTGAPTQNAGIEVERGDEANVQLRWNEGSTKWTFTNDGAVYYPMAVSTTDLAEGTNQYFTTSRARTAISASSASGVSYNSSTGTISLGSIPNSSLTNSSITINGVATSLGGTRTLGSDDVAEGSTNLYFTNARARGALSFTAGSGAYNSTTGVITIPTNTNQLTNGANFATQSYVDSAVAGKDNTDEVTEGTTNLYFTQARARASISVSGSLAYNSTTGVISYTAPTAVSAFTNDAGYITSSASITGNAETATKLATARTISLSGDVTGSVSFDGSANASITATIAANSVALGTDTTGDYVSSLVAGTGITLSNNTGEGATPTVAVDTTTIATKSYVDSAVAGKDNTDEITEGTTNLYFTTARARSSVSAGTGISYNSTTGVISSDTATMATKSYVDTSISNLVGGASAAFDTLKEIQDAMATDAELSAAIAGLTIGNGTQTITAGTGLSGGGSFTANQTGNSSVSLSLASGVVTAGTYSSVTVDTYGRVTAGSNPGYLTSYTETDTLATVTARGATTTSALSTGALTVSGAITATGEVTAYYSDLRLKTNIVPIADALEKVEAINGVTFDPNEAALALGIDDRHQMGVIAQEIEAVAPELVCDSAFAGYKTVRYDKLTALLIEAVKELSAKVKTLEAQLGNTKPTL